VKLFDLEARGTTVAREVRGGTATFLTMAYILFANPAILSAAGMPFGPVVAATAAASALASLLMALGANFPIALAPGMGLNAVIAYQVAPAAGSWQAAMGLVVADGLLMLALVLIGLREALLHAIPRDLRRAIGAGIGLFIAFIGAVNARIVVVPASTVAGLSRAPQAVLPPVTFGSLRDPETLVALLGLVVTAALLARRVRGALLLGIAFSTVLALLLGVARLPEVAWFAVPRFETFGKADLRAAFAPHLLPLLFSILLVDFFDTIGTCHRAGPDRGGLPHVQAAHARGLRRGGDGAARVRGGGGDPVHVLDLARNRLRLPHLYRGAAPVRARALAAPLDDRLLFGLRRLLRGGLGPRRSRRLFPRPGSGSKSHPSRCTSVVKGDFGLGEALKGDGIPNSVTLLFVASKIAPFRTVDVSYWEKLARDRQNAFDQSATLVLVREGKTIGYVPRQYSKMIAEHLDAGHSLEASALRRLVVPPERGRWQIEVRRSS